jgi:hypothetical protein
MPMTNPYLIVKRLNSHGEPEINAIGPFTTEGEMLRFAQGVRYAHGTTETILGKSTKPQGMWIHNPSDLFPWWTDHIPPYEAPNHEDNPQSQ